MKDRTVKILLVLNLIVLTGIFLRQPLPVPSADAQNLLRNKGHLAAQTILRAAEDYFDE